MHIQLTLLLSFLLCAGAHAAPWTVCDAGIKVTDVSSSELSATVVKASPSNPSSCFKPGDALQFAPETPDYQSMLPKSAWPKKGLHAKLRYRELSGICKNDGANQPCTIRHYSILK